MFIKYDNLTFIKLATWKLKTILLVVSGNIKAGYLHTSNILTFKSTLSRKLTYLGLLDQIGFTEIASNKDKYPLDWSKNTNCC